MILLTKFSKLIKMLISVVHTSIHRHTGGKLVFWRAWSVAFLCEEKPSLSATIATSFKVSYNLALFSFSLQIMIAAFCLNNPHVALKKPVFVNPPFVYNIGW